MTVARAHRQLVQVFRGEKGIKEAVNDLLERPHDEDIKLDFEEMTAQVEAIASDVMELAGISEGDDENAPDEVQKLSQALERLREMNPQAMEGLPDAMKGFHESIQNILKEQDSDVSRALLHASSRLMREAEDFYTEINPDWRKEPAPVEGEGADVQEQDDPEIKKSMKSGQFNLVVRQFGRQWNATLINPQGGSSQVGQHPSYNKAVASAIGRGVVTGGKPVDKVWGIHAVMEPAGDDYKATVKKTGWIKVPQPKESERIGSDPAAAEVPGREASEGVTEASQSQDLGKILKVQNRAQDNIQETKEVLQALIDRQPHGMVSTQHMTYSFNYIDEAGRTLDKGRIELEKAQRVVEGSDPWGNEKGKPELPGREAWEPNSDEEEEDMLEPHNHKVEALTAFPCPNCSEMVEGKTYLRTGYEKCSGCGLDIREGELPGNYDLGDKPEGNFKTAGDVKNLGTKGKTKAGGKETKESEEDIAKMAKSALEQAEVDVLAQQAMDDVDEQDNPHAICTAQVGRDDPDYEDCVQNVKKKLGKEDTEEQFHPGEEAPAEEPAEPVEPDPEPSEPAEEAEEPEEQGHSGFGMGEDDDVISVEFPEESVRDQFLSQVRGMNITAEVVEGAVQIRPSSPFESMTVKSMIQDLQGA